LPVLQFLNSYTLIYLVLVMFCFGGKFKQTI
jgi:hypothetical protein